MTREIDTVKRMTPIKPLQTPFHRDSLLDFILNQSEKTLYIKSIKSLINSQKRTL
jgi:hypothetical protein